jgi:hypothetical protein
VRRSGTTTLDQSLGADRCLLVNCDLPATEDMLRDPVLFFRDGERPVVVFDEIHRLSDPTRVLKIAADEFPKLRVVATGSSALEARQAQWPDEPVRYWRDRAGREVDFVRPRARDAVDAYECKGGARAAGESGAGQTIASEPAHPLRAAKPLRRLFQLIRTDCGPRHAGPSAQARQTEGQALSFVIASARPRVTRRTEPRPRVRLCPLTSPARTQTEGQALSFVIASGLAQATR